MSIMSLSRVGNNLIALGIILGVGFMIYSKMDRDKARATIDGIKRLFGGNKNGR